MSKWTAHAQRRKDIKLSHKTIHKDKSKEELRNLKKSYNDNRRMMPSAVKLS